jgi:hypothetical protein
LAFRLQSFNIRKRGLMAYKAGGVQVVEYVHVALIPDFVYLTLDIGFYFI